ncbi:MAG TPA: bifunctional UDP-sugar hydrolase/5'-nucleotidase [Candidatus Limnocylindrales bacterium]|nr:bifunctional UDP-sugar hydrolase/5'-nucleotidase [Candidatus Limnocylindrales bacterium]
MYLTILHTNDEHGALIPHTSAVDFHPDRENPSVGGYARLATAVAQIRQEKAVAGEPVLLLSSGDFIGGSAFSWLVPLGFAPELTLKRMIGYDAIAIGNHEYDYGTDNLARYLKMVGYPETHDSMVALASNTVVPPDHLIAQLGLFRENHIIELENGLKVGLFGLIGKQAVSYTVNHEPIEFSDQHETARRMVSDLQNQGAQLIIALSHSNVEEDRELARSVPGIHVIIGGHSHTALEEPVVENDTIIVQAGSLLKYLGQLHLAFNPATEAVRIRNVDDGEPFLLPLDHSFALDPEVNEAIDSFTAELNAYIAQKTGDRFKHILDVVALSDFKLPDYPPLQESPFGNFIADAMRLITWEKTGQRADFAIQANGSIRGSVIPGTMPHSMDKISFYDLTQLIGLGIGPDGQAGYSIVSVYLTGEEIRRVLEVAVLLSELMGDAYFLQFSGLRYNFNPTNAVLFTVPFLDLPIPTTRAVISAERYTGDGRQGTGNDGYVPLNRGDEQLYNLITDTYIVSFLPMIGEMLPQLNVVLKDSDGNPVSAENLDQLIVRVDGEELKVWQTVVAYAAAQPVGAAGLPQIENYYAATAGRINQVWSIPLVIWPILIIAALIVLIVLLVRRRRRRKLKRRELNASGSR